jgi:hypothetical protein
MKFFLCCHQATHPCPSRTCDTWSWCWRRQYWTSHMEGFPKWRDLQAGLAPEHCAIWKHVSRYCFLIMNTKYMCKILKYDVYSVLYIYIHVYTYIRIYIYYIYIYTSYMCLSILHEYSLTDPCGICLVIKHGHGKSSFIIDDHLPILQPSFSAWISQPGLMIGGIWTPSH